MRRRLSASGDGGVSVGACIGDACTGATSAAAGLPTETTAAGGAAPLPEPSAESIYEFYSQNLFPALWASLPILFRRVGNDASSFVRAGFVKFVHFLLPWTRENDDWAVPSFSTLWTTKNWSSHLSLSASSKPAFVESMLRHLDVNEDGFISGSELLRLEDYQFPYPPHPQTWFSYFQRSWPMMDWKLGVFLWRSCGGLLLLVVIATIVPGRMHRYTGRLLRWPILGFTNFMIFVDLVVYTVIRLFIRFAEAIFANSKHRELRAKMANAKSYDEWYGIAEELDRSQGRDQWRRTIDDDSSKRYNWSFINELMSDMRLARKNDDSLMALAVLQQCTRKNVGGVMSDELFSHTNTGEPKMIAKDFVEEVVTTLRWVTEQARMIPIPTIPEVDEAANEKKEYEEKLQCKVKEEKNKMYGSLMEWATLSFSFSPDKSTIAEEKQRSGKPIVSECDTVRKYPVSSVERHDAGPPAVITTSTTNHLPALHREKVKTFLKRARAAYGRTALCLSGGAMMGLYHFGHVQALLREDALPHIISGTSAGSVVGAMVCTRTEEEIERDMRPEMLESKLKCFKKPWRDRIRDLFRKGHLFDNEEWLAMIQWFTCGDLTFEEAYRKTGRVLCITLSATTKKAPPVLLNYISAPNVVVASAIVASAAVPGFVKPVRLQVKDADGVVRDQAENKDQLYWDGSIEQDIPTSGLAEMLNCQFFLAAQCNPHIVPFFYNSKGEVGRPSRWTRGMRADCWRGGFLLSALETYLKFDMIAKFHFLNDLEAALGFTGSMMTQISYGGTTTIVPQVILKDFFKLFTDPTLDDLYRYFQGGRVAAYQHCAMVKLHYHIAHALDECLARLEQEDGSFDKPRRRRSQLLLQQAKVLSPVQNEKKRNEDETSEPSAGKGTRSGTDCSSTTISGGDDEYEIGGFDGVECAFTHQRPSLK